MSVLTSTTQVNNNAPILVTVQDIITTPVEYIPRFDDGKYIDDFEEYTASTFINVGVTCLCDNRAQATTHYNKSSFKHQHCRNKKHKLYLKNLDTNHADILKISIERRDENRGLKIQIGEESQQKNRMINKYNSLKKKLKII
jgi:hypothetical protein